MENYHQIPASTCDSQAIMDMYQMTDIHHQSNHHQHSPRTICLPRGSPASQSPHHHHRQNLPIVQHPPQTYTLHNPFTTAASLYTHNISSSPAPSRRKIQLPMFEDAAAPDCEDPVPVVRFQTQICRVQQDRHSSSTKWELVVWG